MNAAGIGRHLCSAAGRRLDKRHAALACSVLARLARAPLLGVCSRVRYALASGWQTLPTPDQKRAGPESKIRSMCGAARCSVETPHQTGGLVPLSHRPAPAKCPVNWPLVETLSAAPENRLMLSSGPRGREMYSPQRRICSSFKPYATCACARKKQRNDGALRCGLRKRAGRDGRAPGPLATRGTGACA